MPMLRVRCNYCGAWIPTGMNMDFETFKVATNMKLTVECPSCHGKRTWTLDDVDRSVFDESKKS